MPNWSFDLPGTDEGEPVSFDLHYKRKGKRGEMVAEVAHFDCLPFLPPQAMRYLTLENNALAAVAFIERSLLSEEDAARFLMLINDRKVAVTEEVLAGIVEAMSEHYTGHPTEPPEPSEPGPTPTGGS